MLTVNNTRPFVYVLSLQDGKKENRSERNLQRIAGGLGVGELDSVDTDCSAQNGILAAMAQVVVSLGEPIFPRGVKDVQVESVFDGPGFVRHV